MDELLKSKEKIEDLGSEMFQYVLSSPFQGSTSLWYIRYKGFLCLNLYTFSGLAPLEREA